MNAAEYDVVGVGNAIVDVLSFVEEEFLAQTSLAKGGMTLVDEARSAALYGKTGQATECSGGSVANSLAGLASLGAKCAFIGKVKDDQLGRIFTHDLRAVGVSFATAPASAGLATANCLIYVTPDAQRTMATYIGACTSLTAADIDASLIAKGKITYIEGYLWDAPEAIRAIREAISIARKAGRKVAFTLSDLFCVDRHRAEFIALLPELDVLFANESELCALAQEADFTAACAWARGRVPVIAITRSEKGSVVLTKEAEFAAPTTPVARLTDTTGAGDLYASGFLYGLTRGLDLAACAALGNRCAGEIIQQLGARPQHALSRLVAA